jgi:hypothetical protein
MTNDLLIAALVYGGFIVILFIVLGWVDCFLNFLTLCLKRQTVADCLTLSALGADLFVVAGVAVAGYAVEYSDEDTTRAIAGLGIGAALSLFYILAAVVVAGFRPLLVLALARAAAPLYVLAVLVATPFSNAAVSVALIGIGATAMLLELRRVGPAED